MNAELAWKRREERMNGWTREDVNRIALKQQQAKPSKYKAVKTTVDGIVFDSKKEAQRYHELKLLEKAGQIRGLARQVRFILIAGPKGEGIGAYVADFVYQERQGEDWCGVVEDVKGLRTAMYRWKAKHFSAQFGISIRET